MSRGDTGHFQATASGGECHREGGVVVVLDRLVDVRHGDVVVSHHCAERPRTGLDHCLELAAPDLLDVSTEELSDIAEVAPTSASAPDPALPLYRQLIGAVGLQP